jgi:hypothetical protein
LFPLELSYAKTTKPLLLYSLSLLLIFLFEIYSKYQKCKKRREESV